MKIFDWIDISKNQGIAMRELAEELDDLTKLLRRERKVKPRRSIVIPDRTGTVVQQQK